MLVLFIALGKIVGFSYENAAFWHANSFMVIHFYGNDLKDNLVNQTCVVVK